MLKLKMNNSVSLVTNSWPKSSPAALKKSLSLRAALGTGSCGCDRDVVSLRRSGSLSFPLTKPPVRGFHQLCLITFYSMLGREMRESTENATCILYNIYIYNAYGHIHFYIPFTRQSYDISATWKQAVSWSAELRLKHSPPGFLKARGGAQEFAKSDTKIHSSLHSMGKIRNII